MPSPNDPYGTYVGVPNDYRVVVGQGPRTPQFDATARHYGYYGPTYQNVTRTPVYTNSMLNALWGKGTKQVLSWQMAANALGRLPTFIPGTMDTRTQNALEGLFGDANRNGLTVEDMLKRAKSSRKLMGLTDSLGGGGSGGGGGGPRTVTQSSVNITSREGAQQVLANALTQELGRKPTPGELTRFTRSLNKRERKNPTTTTTHYSGDGSSVSSTTKQGNVDPQYQAGKFAETTSPAERSRFLDSQYLDVISKMIGLN